MSLLQQHLQITIKQIQSELQEIRERSLRNLTKKEDEQRWEYLVNKLAQKEKQLRDTLI